jgi:hypothetical protein
MPSDSGAAQFLAGRLVGDSPDPKIEVARLVLTPRNEDADQDEDERRSG